MVNRNDIIELLTEKGETVFFKLFDTINVDKSNYVFLMPVSDISNEDEVPDEIVIMKVEEKDDELNFTGIEEESELNKVIVAFKATAGDKYDFI